MILPRSTIEFSTKEKPHIEEVLGPLPRGWVAQSLRIMSSNLGFAVECWGAYRPTGF